MSIYTSQNCTPAYQVRWTASLFPVRTVPPVDDWLDSLKQATQADGVRVLEACQLHSSCLSFLVSTLPSVAPERIIWSLKGRLQHCIRQQVPKAFRRNYFLQSIGDPRREIVEDYVQHQLGHHRMADARSQRALELFQMVFDEDLSTPQKTGHGLYVYNLHLCLVLEDRLSEINVDRLETTKQGIFEAARQCELRISRASICSDHLHETIGCPYALSPEEIALATMNSISKAHGEKKLFMYSYYVGTFGDYDMGAIRHSLSSRW